MPWTALNERLLAASAATVGLFLSAGVSAASAAAAVALGIVAVLTRRAPPDRLLTVQDRALMNQDRLVAGMAPGSGTMAIVMYFSSANMPDVGTARDAMQRTIGKHPRFGSVVVETASLEGTMWRSVKVNFTRHVVQHAAIPATAQEARLNELINTDLPRDVPLWRIDLLPAEGTSASSCVLLRASHALGDGLRLVGAAGDFVSFADGTPATVDLVERMTKNKLSLPPRGPLGLARDLVEAATLDKIRNEDPTCLHKPGALFPRATPRANVSASVPLAHVKAIRAAAPPGTTLNDVILACFVGGLRRYAEAVGEPIEGEPLVRAMCAVSLPRQASRPHPQMYNDFLLPSIRLPVGEKTPNARLEAVRRLMAETKASRSGYIMSRLLTLLSSLGLDAFIGQTQLTVFGKHSFIYSNLPGFTQPVHLFDARAKVERFAVYFPNLVSQLLFLSYDGQLTCSLSTDAATITQPQTLVDCFVVEVAKCARD